MAYYYVNDQAQSNTGDHEVHVEGCTWLRLILSKTYLGNFDNCRDAVRTAKAIYRDSDGCNTCSPACHTS